MPAASAADCDFTVIICTRDRVDQLQQTVERVLERFGGFSRAHLVIVDNGSTDGTGDYLKRLLSQDARVMLAYEPTPGLYHARVCGFRHLRSEFFLLLDDDILPSETWPRGVLELLIPNRDIGLIGTAIDPLWVTPRPNWLSERLVSNILTISPSGTIPCRFPLYPAGGSMAGRRVDKLIELYAAPERSKVPLGWGAVSRFGRVGGEDWDLAELYIRNEYRVILTDKVRVHHVVLAQKLSAAWIHEKFFSDGRLRVRYWRFADVRMFGCRTIAQIALFPALWVCAKMMHIVGAPEKYKILITAYAWRAQGMWVELLWGPKHIHLPFRAEEIHAADSP